MKPEGERPLRRITIANKKKEIQMEEIVEETEPVRARSRSNINLYNSVKKHGMSAIEEESEDEQEDDFEGATKANLTINLPKTIRDTFRMRKTEIEMANGYTDLPHLRLNVDTDDSRHSIESKSYKQLRTEYTRVGMKSVDISSNHHTVNQQTENHRWKSTRHKTVDMRMSVLSGSNTSQPTRFEYRAIKQNSYLNVFINSPKVKQLERLIKGCLDQHEATLSQSFSKVKNKNNKTLVSPTK